MRQLLRRLPLSAAVLLTVALLLACGSAPQPTRWAEAQQETKDKSAVSKEALDGKAFNKFFPKVEAPWDLVYEQDKKGAAIANLKKDGKEMAKLSVTDTVSNPEAADKFKEATDKLGGFPHLKTGTHEVGVLVADRFQVKVKSMDDAFSLPDCDVWLEKFDLDGISKLK
jgi:hypothetical protein